MVALKIQVQYKQYIWQWKALFARKDISVHVQARGIFHLSALNFLHISRETDLSFYFYHLEGQSYST